MVSYTCAVLMTSVMALLMTSPTSAADTQGLFAKLTEESRPYPAVHLRSFANGLGICKQTTMVSHILDRIGARDFLCKKIGVICEQSQVWLHPIRMEHLAEVVCSFLLK